MILRRYITKQIASTTFLVLGFLLLLFLGGRLISSFGMAAEGRLDISLVFVILGYNLPFFLELILPLSFFIALMLVFGRLYVDHEMAVLNSSGVSRGLLGRLIIPFIVTLFVCEAGLSLVGKSWGLRNAETIWQQQAMRNAFDLIRPGEFINGGGYHVYVGGISDDKKRLNDVVMIKVADTNDKKDANQTAQNTDNQNNQQHSSIAKDMLVIAKHAEQVPGDGIKGVSQLDLFNGRRYEVSPTTQQYTQVSFNSYRISLTHKQDDTVSEENVETQNTATILQAITKDGQDGANTAAQAELGYRLSLPWLIILAPMMAIPLARVRPRQGRWLRLMPSILLYVSAAMGIISLKKPVEEAQVTVWANLWWWCILFAIAFYLNMSDVIKQRLRFWHKTPTMPLTSTQTMTTTAIHSTDTHSSQPVKAASSADSSKANQEEQRS